jgi:hypothetical protein
MGGFKKTRHNFELHQENLSITVFILRGRFSVSIDRIYLFLSSIAIKTTNRDKVDDNDLQEGRRVVDSLTVFVIFRISIYNISRFVSPNTSHINISTF